MTTTLVTGGAGFIGSHVVDLLLAGGDEVIVIDDLSTGSRENLRHVKAHKRLRIIIDTVLNEPTLSCTIKQSDRVIHLGSPVGVRLLVQDPVRVTHETFAGTAAILKACAAHRRPAFIASSSEVYGMCRNLPFCESQEIVLGSPDRSRWSYGAAKAMGEVLAQAYVRQHGLRVVVGRIFNTSGPRQTGAYGMVIPRFAGLAVRGEPITVYGDGTQTRCFSHVADTVAAIVNLMETPASQGEIVNIGSDQSISIGELALLVREIAGSRSEIIHIPFEEAYEQGLEDMQAREPELSKIRALIGFEPTKDLPAMVADVVAEAGASLRQRSSA